MISPMAPTVLPPDYNPANLNPYFPGSKLNQGMFSPYSGGFNFPSQFGGVSYPQFNMGFNPYGGMFSGFGGSNPYINPYAGMFSPFMQQTQGYDPSGESQLTGPDTPYQSNAFMRNLSYGLYNMPASPIANFVGKHMLKGENRLSLASVTGDNFSSDGPTGGQAGRDAGGYGDYSGRDSDGWGE